MRLLVISLSSVSIYMYESLYDMLVVDHNDDGIDADDAEDHTRHPRSGRS